MSVYRIEGTDEVPEVEIDLDRKIFRMNGFFRTRERYRSLLRDTQLGQQIRGQNKPL